MSDDFCPRQISFLLPGNPGVRVTATEDGSGGIVFTLDVQDTTKSTGDLRAVFFDIDPAAMAGLLVSDGGPFLTESRVLANSVLDLGDGATLAGKVKQKFDVGIEWGTPGGKKDDINFEVGFTLTNAAGNLTLDDLAGLRFGAKLDSVGGPGGVRNSTTKLLLEKMPAAPDAVDDVEEIFEDGAAGLDDPLSEAQGVILYLLDNDTDADTDHSLLQITAIHAADEPGGPMHGTVEISEDGRSVIYTPDTDFSGTDSFYYCISDGNGGQDNALCTVNITAVADDPLISFSVAQGTHINETLVTVTATQTDDDGSEFIDDIDWSVLGGAAPPGVTITPAAVNPGDEPGSIEYQFTVTTGAELDWLFDIDFTATAVETSNLDEEDHTEAKTIEIAYTNTAGTLTYAVDDQNIWATGDAFYYDLGGDAGFFGINVPYQSGGDVLEDPVFGADIAGYSYEYELKAGFQLDVHIEGGAIDASIPVDVTVDATYNKTTDVIYIESATALGLGGTFHTTGPEGSLSLDFIFNYLAAASAFGGPLSVGIGPFSGDYSQNIIDLNTLSSHYDWDVWPGVVEVGVEWPHVSVDNDPGTMSGSDLSNYFLYANLDVDGLANYILGGALSWIDSDPTTEDNFEVLDLDIVGGLKLLQEFEIALAGQTVNLILEDGETMEMTIGTPLWITNASDHDSNLDGIVSFTFDFDPNVELTNTTSINVGMEAQLAFIRNLDLLVTNFTAYNETFPLFDIPIEVYQDTFALAGVGNQSFEFLA